MPPNKYYVIHGHFYQPIRINPFVGELNIERSAYPYENWNFRLLRECYLPNLYAHIKEGDLVLDIVNNYQNISFNIGYTLLSWLEKNASYVLDGILKAKENAMSLAFNHTILPLDPRFDKEIQVYWGIKTHEHYFGVKSRGMWLPECAVNLETLEVLKEYGIEYVILAPHQVFTKTSKNYGFINLKNGKLKVFIYDGILSAKLSFEDLLTDINRLSESLRRSSEMIPIIATDGETFGHHKRFGEMGLGFLSKLLPLKALNALVDELDFDYEFKLVENTSWSCPHGIERWRTHCGCNSGTHPDWQQYWRKPLREAFEFLRTKALNIINNVFSAFKIEMKNTILNYIDVILGNIPAEEYIKNIGITNEQDQIKIAKLLSAYKHIQFMFSSDAWFFDDVANLEVIHTLYMAKYVIYLLKDHEDLELSFVNILEQAKGNTKERPTAKDVYLKDVKAHSLEDIAYNIAVLTYYGYIKDSNVFLKFYYEITKEQNYIYVFIKNLETLEKNSYEFSQKELDISKLFDTFSHRLKKLVLHNTHLSYADNLKSLIQEIRNSIKTFESDEKFFIHDKEEVTAIGKKLLYVMFKTDTNIEDVSLLYKLLVSMNVNVKDYPLTRQATKYLSRKALMLPENEQEFLKILSFVNTYNKNEKDYSLMIGLWETQNIAWSKKDVIQNKSILDALHLVY